MIRKPKRKIIKRRGNPNKPIILNKDYDDQGQLVLGNTPLNSSINYFGIKVLMRPLVFDKLVPFENKSTKYIEEWLLAGKPIASPFLKIKIPYKKWNKGEFEPAKIMGHEGRTRMRSIRRVFGNIPIETHLIIKTDNQWIEGREALTDGELSFDEYIDLLNKEIISEIGLSVKGPWFEV